jgi:hypothetical protein
VKIPFVGPSSTVRSLNADAQRSVNCYLELDQGSPRAPVALYGTPGLVLRATLGSGPIRGGLVMGSYAYVVSGNRVYRLDTAFTSTLLGSIGTSTGDVGMAHNGTQVAIVDGIAGWLATASALSQITDVDFPNGVTRVTSQDGYFIFTGLANSEEFFINETPRNGSTYSGTDFASAEGSPDYTLGCISDHRELWLFGADSAEVWLNTGNPDFPFERSGNTFIEQGCAASGTVAAMDNTVFWLGSNKTGQGIVFRANGYTPVRISNHALERAIGEYETISDAKAFCWQVEGHSFYTLTFPSADHTWLFDASTGEWTEWLWRNPSTNTEHRHRANCSFFFNGEHLVGDWEDGKVYALSLDTYTDNGDPIKRLRRCQTQSKEGQRLFFEEVQIDMETGVGLAVGQGSDPQLMLRYSNDGAHTWSNEKTKTIGAAGEYGARVKFGPTGSGRDRVWEISMTDPVKFAVFGANVRVQAGA